ncbi:MAG: hypothetical protein KC591_06825 [Gemmatimonadetes bacterium]|nr:hypothetical protein [Gemmatimonadota bacterium]
MRSTLPFPRPAWWVRAGSAVAAALLLVGAAVLGGCSAIRIPELEAGRPATPEEFDPGWYGWYWSNGWCGTGESAEKDLDVWVTDPRILTVEDERRLLVTDFTFVAYRGFIGPDDVHRTSGTLFLPLDDHGEVSVRRGGDILVTEFPPGISTSDFDFVRAYGHRPALELDVATAIVDVRGPIVRDLRRFENPSSTSGEAFRSEEQLAYSQLRAFQRSAEATDLLEWHTGVAWIRAVKAVRDVMTDATGLTELPMTLVAEGRGALGAAQAAAVDRGVWGLVSVGWPMDWLDAHWVRWRRWEREARVRMMAELQPIPYGSSRDVVSFLRSSYREPDPECPSCPGSGQRWRSQLEIGVLKGQDRGPMDGVALLNVVGDSDPEWPIDLEARVALSRDETAFALPSPLPDGVAGPAEAVLGGESSSSRGPWASRITTPWEALTYLPGAPSTLANETAARAALAWAERVAGNRETPPFVVMEGLKEGDVVVDIVARDAMTSVKEAWLWAVDVPDRADGDFKRAVHEGSEMGWRRVPAFFAGPAPDGSSVWRARLPIVTGRNQAYYPVVQTRVAGRDAEYSLPVRVLWNLGDPGLGAVWW